MIKNKLTIVIAFILITALVACKKPVDVEVINSATTELITSSKVAQSIKEQKSMSSSISASIASSSKEASKSASEKSASLATSSKLASSISVSEQKAYDTRKKLFDEKTELNNKILTQITNLTKQINNTLYPSFPENEPAWVKELNAIKANVEALKSKIPLVPTTNNYNKNDVTVLESTINNFINLIQTHNYKIDNDEDKSYNNWAVDYNLLNGHTYDILKPYTPTDYQELQDLDQNGEKTTTQMNFTFNG